MWRWKARWAICRIGLCCVYMAIVHCQIVRSPTTMVRRWFLWDQRGNAALRAERSRATVALIVRRPVRWSITWALWIMFLVSSQITMRFLSPRMEQRSYVLRESRIISLPWFKMREALFGFILVWIFMVRLLWVMPSIWGNPDRIMAVCTCMAPWRIRWSWYVTTCGMDGSLSKVRIMLWPHRTWIR